MRMTQCRHNVGQRANALVPPRVLCCVVLCCVVLCCVVLCCGALRWVALGCVGNDDYVSSFKKITFKTIMMSTNDTDVPLFDGKGSQAYICV
jgi:hypothetical protein